MRRKSWFISGLLWAALLALMLSAQTLGYMLRGDVLGFVSSNKFYLTDVEHRITMNTHVEYAQALRGMWSPDLQYVAFVDTRADLDIMILNLASGETQSLTSDSAQNLNPQWSPDGSKIAYISDLDGTLEIYVMDLRNSSVQQVTNGSLPQSGYGWLPDSQHIVYLSILDQDVELLVSDLATGSTETLADDIDTLYLPVWSPDEQQIAYVSVVDSQHEIYLRDMVTQETRLLLSVDLPYFRSLQWSASGEYLAAMFLSLDGDYEVYTLNIQTGERLDIFHSNTGAQLSPLWSPAGERLAFVSNRSGNSEVYILDVTSGDTHNISNNPRFNVNPGWMR